MEIDLRKSKDGMTGTIKHNQQLINIEIKGEDEAIEAVETLRNAADDIVFFMCIDEGHKYV